MDTRPAAPPTEADAPDGFRVLVLAPTRRDNEVTLDLLRRAEISAVSCDGISCLVAQLDMPVGSILLTDAVFADPGLGQLLVALARQPPWSDVPIVLLCRTDPTSLVATRALNSLHNVTVLERPTSSRTLVSSIRAALRARARQYQLREQFEALRVSEGALRDSERRFRTMINSIPQLAWMAHADGSIHWYNGRWYEYTGTTPQEMEGWGWQRVHDPEYLPKVLEKWTATIAAGTNFEMEFPLRGAGGEFRMFLTRVVPLKGEFGQVVQWFGTNTDVQDAKQTEMRLRTTEAALREADHRKDLFLATLAHELRNPLAPIRTAAQILASPRLAAPQLQWAQSVIQRQTGHMALLLDDLLDIARITQGKLELKIDRVRLTDVVGSAVEEARPLLDSKNHQLTVTLPPEELTLEADPLRLSQILSNLLNNAAKYTDPAGHIELSACAKNGEVCLLVKDDGIGIAPGALSRIFEMFSQVDGAAARSEGGLGIGLALVKGLLDLHGGTIEARSGGPGQGSEFIVRLPFCASAAAEGSVANVDAAPVAAQGRRVLIADDNKDAADSLAMLLELAGHEVRVAHRGRAALALAQTFRPAVAIIDLGMPDLSGYDVAKELRRESWGADICLIALTGWGRDDDRHRSKAAGFDRHITKPVEPRELETLLSNDN